MIHTDENLLNISKVC